MLFSSQFAFKPNFSTIAALISTCHYVTSMLKNNSYVQCNFTVHDRCAENTARVAICELMNQECLVRHLIQVMSIKIRHNAKQR